MTRKKYRLRLGAFFSALLLAAALSSTAFAATPCIAVDGIDYRSTAFYQESITYIPMRPFPPDPDGGFV